MVCTLTFPMKNFLFNFPLKKFSPLKLSTHTTMNDQQFLEWTTPIAGAMPAGENLEYDPRMAELEEKMAGQPERAMGDSVIPAEPPDYRKIEKAAVALMQESRDLRIVVIWTISRLANSGVNGLLEGLKVIAALSENMWDDLLPVPDDGDVQERISALTRLSPAPGSFDADRSVPRLLLEVPLTDSPQLGMYGLREVNEAPEGSDAARTIHAALRDTPEEKKTLLLHNLEESLNLLKQIRDVYASHNQGTPDFSVLSDMLKQMQIFLTVQSAVSTASLQETVRTGSDDVEKYGSAIQNALAPQNIPVFSSAGPDAQVGRSQMVQLMHQVSDWFRKNEPSSPVPYFLQRAIRSVGVSYIDLVADIDPSSMERVLNVLKPDAKREKTPIKAESSPIAAPNPSPSSQAEDGYFSPFGG